jgi:hypothetical protein
MELQFLLSSALRTASVSNVPDILATVGSKVFHVDFFTGLMVIRRSCQGSHISDIAKKAGIDASKLGAILRIVSLLFINLPLRTQGVLFDLW